MKQEPDRVYVEGEQQHDEHWDEDEKEQVSQPNDLNKWTQITTTTQSQIHNPSSNNKRRFSKPWTTTTRRTIMSLICWKFGMMTKMMARTTKNRILWV